MCALHKGNQEYEFSVYTWISLYNLDHIKSNIKGIKEGKLQKKQKLNLFPMLTIVKDQN